MQTQQWIYTKAPSADQPLAQYALRKAELAPLGVDQVLLQAKVISVDPYMRINQAQSHTWMPPHALNTVQGAGAVSEVIESNAAQFKPGDMVLAHSGWQTHAILHQSELTRVDPDAVPIETALGVLGMPGRTAYFGLLEHGRVKLGDVVVVSGAAGAVGSIVVQLAKLAGAKVLALAGSSDKCDCLVNELGADIALNYKEYSDYQALSAAIEAKVGKVDVYFDNTGGMISDAVLTILAKRARVVICGQISQYLQGLDQVELGPRFLHHILYQRATISGVLARDYTHRMDEMLKVMTPLIKASKMKFQTTWRSGFENLPKALAELFDGTVHGKLLVRI
jgi:NADPH-dependent curcumin reductase CurA